MLKDLAQAIREGGKGHNQTEGRFARLQDNGEYAYCALGAAVHYWGIPPESLIEMSLRDVRDYLEEEYAISLGKYYLDPINGYDRLLWSIILDLNDNSHWTFDHIADWVASLEER